MSQHGFSDGPCPLKLISNNMWKKKCLMMGGNYYKLYYENRVSQSSHSPLRLRWVSWVRARALPVIWLLPLPIWAPHNWFIFSNGWLQACFREGWVGYNWGRQTRINTWALCCALHRQVAQLRLLLFFTVGSPLGWLCAVYFAENGEDETVASWDIFILDVCQSTRNKRI